jgi:hypothetical protein
MLRRIVCRMLGLHPSTEFVPPGHFYSALPCIEEIRKKENTVWGRVPPELPGIDLDIQGQLGLLDEFAGYYRDLPFRAKQENGLRYFYENPNYPYGDAAFLHCMMRKLRPRRIIEAGSGYSSCVMIDTNELFLGGTTEITFVEPYPDLLVSLFHPGDKEKYPIIARGLQEVELDRFRLLQEGDILFIDSTHVSKLNSDVNHILFKILPVLKSGVHIHFHDIFYPFEYPKEWIYAGRAWNENYILRAFMQYNSAFKIVLFGSFLAQLHRNKIEEALPICLKNPGGSIWIKKV